jgi:hypothetical protein
MAAVLQSPRAATAVPLPVPVPLPVVAAEALPPVRVRVRVTVAEPLRAALADARLAHSWIVLDRCGACRRRAGGERSH